jgi:hypothetical protein
MTNLIVLDCCQFCGVPIRKPEVKHDGLPTHASCLFAHITARSVISRIQRESKRAARCVAKLRRQ